MKYDFDKIIDRSGSGDLKHEALLPRWGRKDLLPLWVADMDLRHLHLSQMPSKTVWNILSSAIR